MSRLQSFETELLAQEENLAGLEVIKRPWAQMPQSLRTGRV